MAGWRTTTQPGGGRQLEPLNSGAMAWLGPTEEGGWSPLSLYTRGPTEGEHHATLDTAGPKAGGVAILPWLFLWGSPGTRENSAESATAVSLGRPPSRRQASHPVLLELWAPPTGKKPRSRFLAGLSGGVPHGSGGHWHQRALTQNSSGKHGPLGGHGLLHTMGWSISSGQPTGRDSSSAPRDVVHRSSGLPPGAPLRSGTQLWEYSICGVEPPARYHSYQDLGLSPFGKWFGGEVQSDAWSDDFELHWPQQGWLGPLHPTPHRRLS